MRSFFRALLLCLCLTGLASSQSGLDRVTKVSHTLQGDVLRLVIETKDREPEASAYFLNAPDRFVVDINDALPSARLQGKPASNLITSWTLRKRGLNRTQLILNLKESPASTGIKVNTLDNPPRLEIELSTEVQTKEKIALTAGVTWIREDSFLAGRWTRLNRLLFDPTDSNIEIIMGLAKERTDSRETVSSMVARYDALAGINGGFFAGGGGALGLIYREGKMLAPHVSRRPPRSGLGITKSGRVIYGRIAAVGSTIKDLDGGDWSEAWHALGGGPRLIKDGKENITADLEQLGPKGNDITRVAARTLVGSDKNGKLTFATVTGYNDNHSQGAQFGPLVAWLKTLGITDAVNFDGGASVDMVIGGHIVSDGPGNRSQEKPVATALLVRDRREKLYASKALWRLSHTVLPADGKTAGEIEIVLSTPSGQKVPDGTAVRLLGSNVVVEPSRPVSRDGIVKAKFQSIRRPGTAKIQLFAGPLSDLKTLTLKAGPASRLMAYQVAASPVKDKPLQKVRVEVQTLDQWGNGVPKEIFEVAQDGLPKTQFSTETIGVMTLELEMPLTGGTVSFFHPSTREVRLVVPAITMKKEKI